jgi:hypothetical protein
VALSLLDIDSPLAVVCDGVHAQADDFAVSLFELLFHAGQITEFSRADGSEVFRMREQDAPGVAHELMKADAALGGFSLEIGCHFINSQRHIGSPL